MILLLWVAPSKITQWYSVGRWADLEGPRCLMLWREERLGSVEIFDQSTCMWPLQGGCFKVIRLYLASSGLSGNLSQEIQMEASRLLRTYPWKCHNDTSVTFSWPNKFLWLRLKVKGIRLHLSIERGVKIISNLPQWLLIF